MASNLIAFEVQRVLFDLNSKAYLLVMKESDGERFLPIAIGSFEADSVMRSLEELAFERPLTHDLISVLLSKLDVELEKVVINDLEEDVFYARLIIRQNGRRLSVDARPSDSIAIALRARCPIFVSAKVLEQAGLESDPFEEMDEPEGWGPGDEPEEG